MKRLSIVPLLFLLSALLTGCWDQRLLKEARLILCVGYNEAKDGKVVLSTIITRNLEKKPPDLFVTEGKTPRDARITLQRKLTFVPDASKNRIVLLSDPIAKKGNILELLDVIYRDPRSALNAKIAVVQGSTNTLLKEQAKSNPDLVAYLDRQIVTSEAATIAPDVDLQSLRTGIMDPGRDIILPYMGLNQSKVEIIGAALFHDQKQTGTITPRQTTIALLLANQKGENTALTLPTTKGNHMTVNVLRMKHKLTVHESGGQIQAQIDVKMDVDAIEVPDSNLEEPQQAEELNRLLSSALNKEAQQVIKQLQAANCDLLGIGRRLIAFNHSYWNRTNWEKEYPKINITPSFQINIAQHGILN